MVKINFVLPFPSQKPIGGYKIIFQYANLFAEKGHDVTISFCYTSFPKLRHKFIDYLKLMKNFSFKTRNMKKMNWFDFNDEIKFKFNCFSAYNFPDADIVIATSAPTSYLVSDLPLHKGNKFYFIQGYENWYPGWSKETLEATYKLGMKNIVISKELKNKISEITHQNTYYVPNFYDKNEFFISNDIEKRENIVSLLNHEQSTKRTEMGLKILAKVKEYIPDLKVELFGAYEMPKNLPRYVNYTFKATSTDLREQIYGKSKIYLLPSELEGWGLTGMEAMASGAVLVASDIGGIKNYATKKNSVLVNVDNFDDFVFEIINLLTDDRKRITFANKANEDVNKFEVNAIANKFLNILLNNEESNNAES